MLYLIERDKRFELLLTGKEDFVDIDFLLIRKMKQGDDDAFDTFVRKYYDDILRYCGYHCSDAEYAEDLTQETFANFFAKLSDYRHKRKNPDEFRQVIDLYYFQEMKLTEIAGVLGIGLPLVKYRLKQARNRLQSLLRKEGAVNEPG